MKSKISTLFLSFFLLYGSSGFSQEIIGITETDMLFKISNAANPTTTTLPVAITGITSGQTIEGLDYRPSTGQLYALGYNIGSGEGQLYTIDPATAIATVVNATPFVLTTGSGSIGFDFNPVVDRIRVVSAFGTNYRLNPNDGTIAATDVNLDYDALDINGNSTPAIGACAYLNSYIASELTTLYGYDENLNVLVTINPPNSGVLHTTGSSFITVNTSDPTTDMDIYFDPATNQNTAYFSANASGSTIDNLYRINLSAGLATNVGQIGNPGLQVKDIAVVINRTLPPLTGSLIYALTKTSGNLISFDSDNPSFLRSFKPVTGLSLDQILVGIDVRPQDLLLYGLGYNFSNSEYQLYRIDINTGVATAINAVAGTLNLGAGQIGFDFNPTVDRIRVVSDNGANYRLNPLDGTIAASDLNLAYATGDINSGQTPNVASVAYINSYRGAALTTLYGFDENLNAWLTINPPNSGTLNTIASNVLPFNMADLTNDIDFFYDSLSQTNQGYIAATTINSLYDSLYRINVAGSIAGVGQIGYGIFVKDIAVQLLYKNSTVGLNDTENETAKFNVYPNPVNDITRFEFPLTGNSESHIVIADISGRIVKDMMIAQAQTFTDISLAYLNSGMYTVSFYQDGKLNAITKLIKQ